MAVIILYVWHVGLFSMTASSRLLFGFSRDGGLPQFFTFISPTYHTPIRTVCLAASLSFLLIMPSLGSSVALSAATSIAASGQYVSYAIPICLGFLYPARFSKGPFNLRIASRFVAAVAVGWICFLLVSFCLPDLNPVNSQTFNYTPVAVGVIATWAFGSWFLWAKRWFTGPVRRTEAVPTGLDAKNSVSSETVEKSSRTGEETEAGP